ncbi:MAG: hypothetical protein IKM41_01235, partial [Tidjanibacter sp.]|nr:hypothetical protein [Tidjanibacter sp.]
MKRTICIALAALAAVVLVGCGGSKRPDVVVAKCWTELAAGNVKAAVELIDVPVGEEHLYVEMFSERTAKLQEVGGVERVDIYSYDEGKTEARVEATVVLANGQSIPATYTL